MDLRLLAATVCGLVLCCAAPAGAATVTVPVTTTADAVAADGATSLREALASDAAQPGDDLVVTVPAGYYDLAGPNQPVILDRTALASVTIRGAGARDTVLDGRSDGDIVLGVAPGVTASVSGVTITGGNDGWASGGGISNAGTLTVSDATIIRNRARAGGGIYNGPDGTLTVVRSTITRNEAFVELPGGVGGGIANAGDLRVVLSTISENETSTGSNTGGGGLYQASTGGTLLDHVTIARNVARRAAGGGNVFAEGAVAVLDSLVARGGAVGCSGTPLSRPSSGDRSLSDDAACGVTTVAGLVVPFLRDNGGPTDTIALPAGSPAIDAAETCTGRLLEPLEATMPDQRGLPRPSGARCDVGAFEVQVPPKRDEPPADTPGDTAKKDDRSPGAECMCATPPARDVPAALAAPVVAPVQALRIAPSRFRPGTGRGRGATVTFRAAAGARVRLRVERLTPGRRAGGSCVRPTRANRARAGCTRRVLLAGGLSRTAVAGTTRVRLTGRLGGRTLAPGRHALVAVVVDGARASAPRRVAFTVLR